MKDGVIKLTEYKGLIVLTRVDLSRIGEGYLARTDVYGDCGTHLGPICSTSWVESVGDATTRSHNSRLAQLHHGVDLRSY
jgi:hypothetical protein